MNILFLSHRVPFPANKGEKIRTFHQIKYLREQGHTIFLAAPYEDESELEYFDALKDKFCEQVLAVKLASKWLRYAKGLLKNQAMSVANFESKELANKVSDLVKNHKIDAIICTASSMAPYVFGLGEDLKSIPCFMDFMDLDSDKWSQYKVRSSFPMSLIYAREASLTAKLEDEIQKKFEACFFISQNEVDLFSKTSETDNVYVMGNGLDTNEFYPATSGVVAEALNSPNFLFTGVMDYPPNEDAVIWFCEEVWENILKQWPEATFTIAGMNPSDSVQQLTNLKGVEVTGFVDEILPYYHRADIFVAPFRLARGVQNKVLQAFACGLPVVTTSMGTEGIDCSHGQEYLQANTPHETFSHVKTLVEDSCLRDSIGKHALTLIEEKYSWDGMLKILDRCLTASLKPEIAGEKVVA